MKIRTSFVSNSSSSSFVCDVCGENYSGRDACLSEAEMFECGNGHYVCLDHAVGSISEEDHEEYPYEILEKHCPLCSFKKIEYKTACSYLLKSLNMTEEQLLQKLNKRFKNYEEYLKYLK